VQRWSSTTGTRCRAARGVEKSVIFGLVRIRHGYSGRWWKAECVTLEDSALMHGHVAISDVAEASNRNLERFARPKNARLDYGPIKRV
jgi:hypothetical protein